MSRRLTNQIRDDIVKNALAAAPISAQCEEIQGEYIMFAQDYCTFRLGGEEKVVELEEAFKKVSKVLSDLPELGQLSHNRKSMIRLMLHDDYGAIKVVQLPEPHFAPGDYTLIIQEPKWEKRFKGINRRMERAQEEKVELEITIRQTLASVTTVKRLIDTWPEVSELIPAYAFDQPKPQLPAVPVSSLNASIGLPLTEVAAA